MLEMYLCVGVMEISSLNNDQPTETSFRDRGEGRGQVLAGGGERKVREEVRVDWEKGKRM